MDFAQIGPRCPFGKACIGMVWTQDTHVDTSHGGCLQGKEHGFVGNEVGRLEIDITTGGRDGTYKALHNLRIACRGTAGHYLAHWRGVCCVLCAALNAGGIVVTVGYQRTIHEIPVYQESPLQRVDDRPLQAQHRIAPGLVARSLHIAQGDVHATDITHLTIDDNDFAVVTVVHLAGKCREMYGQERLHLDTSFSHPFEKMVGHSPTAHVIVDDTHLDTLT